MIKKILASIAAIAALSAPAFADGDAEKGKKVFKKCQACHQVGEDAKNRVGPILNGVIERQAGAIEDFKYSDAMVEAGEKGLIWTHENIAEYLKKPRDFIPGNKMTFAGLRKEDDIEDVIAYLEIFPGEEK
ncbi:cytochrome c family protein [Roseovarius sp. M141]|uniref:c-type cytochrome n=1 Tax=Roseovarius sp. M141 TaxID=2583806 RepID=UPI0020CC1283|nr:cytochrome c family protein [Roseovarius sp. M141]MCQ0090440.1 cytochrome c family protein [Roseovarius sp. M141]